MCQQKLTFGGGFEIGIQDVTLPSGLQSITLGDCVNQNMESVTPAERLEERHLWRGLQPENGEMLPSDLQSNTLAVVSTIARRT